MEGKKFYHLGHAVLDCFRRRPDAISQIDAATGESETNASVLSRSIHLATCLKTIGLVPGDILALGGKNHLDLQIPYFAGLFNGLPLLGVDPLFKHAEIKSLFKLTSPKVAFCNPEDYENYAQAAQDLGLDMKIFTFGDGPHSMRALIAKYPCDINENDYELPEFDLDKVYLWLISTSGTTGGLKVAAFTHEAGLQKSLQYAKMIKVQDSLPSSPALHTSPVQWLSGIYNHVGMPLLNQTKVQTSASLTVEHLIDIINKYKPTQTMIGPGMLTNILRHEKTCDLSCFDSIIISGSTIPADLVREIRSKLRKDAVAFEMYAQTETLGPALFPRPDTPMGSAGQPAASYQAKLVDPETEKNITEPNVPGEIWIKGASMFKEYYNNPEATAEAFSKDGWFKSGDLMYTDERGNYYYLTRIKTLIKYQNYHVVPSELEDVIRAHPAVADVAVVGVPDAVDGEHPLACVVRKKGFDVHAQEIKDLVAEKLSVKKQLRGGVIFLQELPLTSTGKVHLGNLKTIILTLDR